MSPSTITDVEINPADFRRELNHMTCKMSNISTMWFCLLSTTLVCLFQRCFPAPEHWRAVVANHPMLTIEGVRHCKPQKEKKKKNVAYTCVINLSVKTESRTCCPWLAFEKKKREVADLTDMRTKCLAFTQNDNKIVHPLGTIRGFWNWNDIFISLFLQNNSFEKVAVAALVHIRTCRAKLSNLPAQEAVQLPGSGCHAAKAVSVRCNTIVLSASAACWFCTGSKSGTTEIEMVYLKHCGLVAFTWLFKCTGVTLNTILKCKLHRARECPSTFCQKHKVDIFDAEFPFLLIYCISFFYRCQLFLIESLVRRTPLSSRHEHME